MKTFGVTLIICALAFIYRAGIDAPLHPPFQTLVTIEQNSSLHDVAEELSDAGVIRSPLIFKALFYVPFFDPSGAIAGDYFFDKPQNAFMIAKKILHGEFGLVMRRLTIPEGLNKYEIAALAMKKFPKFNRNNFLNNAKEGYLFPDTYFLELNGKEDKLISLMENNFDKKIATIDRDINDFKKPLNDIITIASILETEARLTETREIIAGILWKRLSLGMPLQVDVTFKYINGKNSSNLTLTDLAIDSPYNTYKYKGLPPTPIANPGLDAILAAVHPTKSKYLYFLSDSEGVMHYAKTFDEHKENKRLYLK